MAAVNSHDTPEHLRTKVKSNLWLPKQKAPRYLQISAKIPIDSDHLRRNQINQINAWRISTVWLVGWSSKLKTLMPLLKERSSNCSFNSVIHYWVCYSWMNQPNCYFHYKTFGIRRVVEVKTCWCWQERWQLPWKADQNISPSDRNDITPSHKGTLGDHILGETGCPCLFSRHKSRRVLLSNLICLHTRSCCLNLSLPKVWVYLSVRTFLIINTKSAYELRR